MNAVAATMHGEKSVMGIASLKSDKVTTARILCGYLFVCFFFCFSYAFLFCFVLFYAGWLIELIANVFSSTCEDSKVNHCSIYTLFF